MSQVFAVHAVTTKGPLAIHKRLALSLAKHTSCGLESGQAIVITPREMKLESVKNLSLLIDS